MSIKPWYCFLKLVLNANLVFAVKVWDNYTKLQPAVLRGLDFPFYRFLWCFAVCYKKIFSHRSGALITWIGKVSWKIFLKADMFGADALDKSFMPNGFSVAVTRSFSTLLFHCRLGLAASFSYLKSLRSVVRYKLWLFHYRKRNWWFLGLIYR